MARLAAVHWLTVPTTGAGSVVSVRPLHEERRTGSSRHGVNGTAGEWEVARGVGMEGR